MKEGIKMKTSLELLEEIKSMGYSHEEALNIIDASLDEELGYENRKELSNETISEDLYNTIISSLEVEIEADNERKEIWD